MPFAVDENFNNDVLRGVRRRAPDVDIVRIHDIGLSSADDSTILAWCAEEGRVLFTHDVNTMTAVAYDRVRDGLASPRHVEIDDLLHAMRKKLPQYPLPVLRLARLAVDESARAHGIGALLLRFILQLAARMADEYECIGVVVDAKPEAIAFYAKYGFVALDLVEGNSDAKPKPTPMFLSTRTIKAAVTP